MPRRLLPPHLFVAALAVTLVLVVAIPAWPSLYVARFLGPLLLALGMWILVLGHGAISRSGSPLDPFRPPKVLITNGIFAVSRNPIYLGFVLITGGLGLLGAQPWALIPCVILFAILNWHFVRVEEANAEAAFGEAYRSYRSDVRRWI